MAHTFRYLTRLFGYGLAVSFWIRNPATRLRFGTFCRMALIKIPSENTLAQFLTVWRSKVLFTPQRV